jgi:hypothetical protein
VWGESVDGSESVFNAENLEAQEAQSESISDNNVANVEMLSIQLYQLFSRCLAGVFNEYFLEVSG